MEKSDMGGKEPITFSIEGDIIDTIDHICGQKDINRSQAIREALKEWASRELSKIYPEFWDRVAYGIRNRSKSSRVV
jgi:hypothetical protein